MKEYNPNWPQIPNHPYKILTNAGSESGKANAALLNLVNEKLYTFKSLFVR